jgi:hypothetical protein
MGIKIVAFIFGDLFTSDKRKLNVLSFEDLNKRFNDFRYVFTPGYIREHVLIYYSDNKSDIDKKIEQYIKEENDRKLKENK